ncbi:MAG: YidC/Oxa1 family membrane protein insertase [Clostridia bacterium]|nr:YidC/Oxa1 family membrane protein insertase [Clostridia bacterium]
MFAFFANLFGYLLNFLYNIIQNYGFSIIIFSIIVKIALLPISINQQKTMKKTAKVQDELKKLQIKNKNNPEALQRETMELYKREKMNPFGGCFTAIVQFILLISVFYLIRCPLTYMKKVEPELMEKYTQELSEGEDSKKDSYVEISIIREKAAEDDNVFINMEFLGLDLSSIPSRDLSDWRTYVIPVLYVITTFISIRITTSMQKKQKSDSGNESGEGQEIDIMMQTNKNMSLMMPILAVSISLVAPLGLALYWLTNNIIMIAERLLLNVLIKDEEEEVDA